MPDTMECFDDLDDVQCEDMYDWESVEQEDRYGPDEEYPDYSDMDIYFDTPW